MYSMKIKNRTNPAKTGASIGSLVPPEWTFRSEAIAQGFDSHVREQLPWYDLATRAVAHYARHYLPAVDGIVVDVGASTGNIGRALAATIEARDATIFPIDASEDMAKVYNGPGTLKVIDAVDYDFANAAPDLVVCFLSLMFVPIVHREALIARMVEATRAGGAVIVFDKTLPRPGYLGTVNYRLSLALKADAGAAPEEIVAKELSLAGFQRPIAERELLDAGFVEVFRFGDFAGFVREC